MSNSRDNGPDTTTVDVVIVGAGFAGLSAADRLVSMGKTVRVVEGRDRVGGRSFSGEVAGVKVDFGATWVSPRHNAIRDLAKRVGCSTTAQYNKGRQVMLTEGRRRTYSGTIPTFSPLALADMYRIQTSLEKLVETIDIDAAWESPRAAEFDAITFGEWLDHKRASAGTRALMNIISKVQWGSDMSGVSLLHALRYIRAVGGIDHMIDVENGQNQDRITETTQEIANRVAESLGDSVVVGTPVRRIEQDDDSVTVWTDTEVISAQFAIVTTAPAHRADIVFEPALPAKAQSLTRTWHMGALSKAFVAYDRPFWRHNGLSGEAVTDTGTVFITFDVSPASGPGVLMAFCDPRMFDDFDAELRQKQVIHQLVKLYGAEASTPIDYADHCWGTDDFAPGGPNPAVAPFATTNYASALTEPHGRVHWAGTETAGEWAGCMNGAVLTGLRAAERVAALAGVAAAVDTVDKATEA